MNNQVIKDIQEYFKFYGCSDIVIPYHDINPKSSAPKGTLFIKYASGAGGFAFNPDVMTALELSNFKYHHVFGK